jgi:hypothetical protein
MARALLARAVGAALLVLAGLATTAYALLRLGWRRHNARWTDLRWLHPEWFGHLGDHPAHRDNLVTLSTGLGLLLLAAALASGAWSRRRRLP